MKKTIINKLNEIEKKYNISILLAIESGSRAWGFPSLDSDYDVRFIYKHNPDWYISISEKKDTIERMFSKELDFGGWDIRKTLKLLKKSNASIFEWMQSPIRYSANKSFLNGLKKLSNDSFSPITCVHHYLSMSKKYYNSFTNSDSIKIKSLFYALRTSLAGKWIVKNKTYPPIQFQILLDHLVNNKRLKLKIERLMENKQQATEKYQIKYDKMLVDYIKKTIEQVEKKTLTLPSSKITEIKLDHFLRKTVMS